MRLRHRPHHDRADAARTHRSHDPVQRATVRPLPHCPHCEASHLLLPDAHAERDAGSALARGVRVVRPDNHGDLVCARDRIRREKASSSRLWAAWDGQGSPLPRRRRPLLHCRRLGSVDRASARRLVDQEQQPDGRPLASPTRPVVRETGSAPYTPGRRGGCLHSAQQRIRAEHAREAKLEALDGQRVTNQKSGGTLMTRLSSSLSV